MVRLLCIKKLCELFVKKYKVDKNNKNIEKISKILRCNKLGLDSVDYNKLTKCINNIILHDINNDIHDHNYVNINKFTKFVADIYDILDKIDAKKDIDNAMKIHDSMSSTPYKIYLPYEFGMPSEKEKREFKKNYEYVEKIQNIVGDYTMPIIYGITIDAYKKICGVIK